MSTDLNNLSITGRLTRDAELKYLPSGMELLNFSIANNKSFKKDDEWKTEVMFLDCVVWGKYGAAIVSKLLKGNLVNLTGRLKQERWENQAGEQRSKIVLTCDSVQVILKADDSVKQESETKNQKVENKSDEDIPF